MVGLAMGLVRTKLAAVLIGATGVGLVANFMAIQGLVGTLAGLGIQASGVRDVARSYSADDNDEIGRTIVTLRRVCWITGMLGAAGIVTLSPWLSRLTFGTSDHQAEIAALGLVILLGNISGGQSAILQGSRRITELARVQITVTLLGTALTGMSYAWLGIRGIVPALVVMAGVQLVLYWWTAKRVPVPLVAMTWRESIVVAGGMVRLGVVMMWTGLLSSAVSYATNTLIVHHDSVAAVGIYSAAYALSGMFVNFVLQAMGADYYPRLAGVAHDREAMRRMVNEQTEIGLLLAVPGLLATLALAPWIVRLFYSREFVPAVNLLQWFVLGCLGRVASWPLAYVMIALGRGKWYLLTETSVQALYLGSLMVALPSFGLEGVAVAFFLQCFVYVAVAHRAARILIGASWSAECRWMLSGSMLLAILVIIAARFLDPWESMLVGVPITLAAALVSIRGLAQRVGLDHPVVDRVMRVPGMRALCGSRPGGST